MSASAPPTVPAALPTCVVGGRSWTVWGPAHIGGRGVTRTLVACSRQRAKFSLLLGFLFSFKTAVWSSLTVILSLRVALLKLIYPWISFRDGIPPCPAPISCLSLNSTPSPASSLCLSLSLGSLWICWTSGQNVPPRHANNRHTPPSLLLWQSEQLGGFLLLEERRQGQEVKGRWECSKAQHTS